MEEAVMEEAVMEAVMEEGLPGRECRVRKREARMLHAPQRARLRNGRR